MKTPTVIIALPNGTKTVYPLPEGALFAIENECADRERIAGYVPTYAEVVALILEDLWYSGEVSQPTNYIPASHTTN